jgi:hypothetical protein
MEETMNQPIYLDEATVEAIKQAAEKEKVSVAAWIKDAALRKLEIWPEAVTKLAGAWQDFPVREDLDDLPRDLTRETL